MAVKLDDVMPPISLPTTSHQRFGASAISAQSIASPAVEIRITGRRPKRSDSEPITGEQTNCMPAHMAAIAPFQMPAEARDPANSSISSGKTGMTRPIAMTSSTPVTSSTAG